MRIWRQLRGQCGKDNINLSPEGLCRVPRLLSMYMHKKENSLNNLLDAIVEMDERELDRLQAALNHRRDFLNPQEKPEHRPRAPRAPKRRLAA